MSLSYKDAGVDIAAADTFVGRIARLARATHGGRVVDHESKYSGLIAPDLRGMAEPLLAATCDGVGTKLLVAKAVGKYDGLGQDLVAMSVNDLMPLAARPLLFLDYLAVGKLDAAAMEVVVGSVARACSEVGCALLGGETAEMPGMYHGEDYDLAGFCVGVVEKDAIIDGTRTAAGDAIIGLASSGPHSNGYSLIRKLLTHAKAAPDTLVSGKPLYERLLAPTRIYVKPLLALLRALPVHGLAHITGGGLTDNIPRVLPDGLEAVLERTRWPRDPVFDWLQNAGRIEPAEMYRTFNCGIGMVAVVPAAQAAAALALLAAHGETAAVIGEVRSGGRGVHILE